MPHPRYSAGEIAACGQRIYADRLRSLVETPANIGKYLVIDVESGEYELDADRLTVSERAAARHPGAPLFAMRIGYPTLGHMGLRPSRPRQQ